ncbi:hypothetical protein [Agromyces subbeticus]|uniref:hypothetical protein n=1 Tax=Agromyces subbeticus TaxID=293890 RepID=UPI0003B39FE3|nr:hypothetical protein [Agromyces subbeticus]
MQTNPRRAQTFRLADSTVMKIKETLYLTATRWHLACDEDPLLEPSVNAAIDALLGWPIGPW